MQQEENLVRLARQGEPGAFEQLYESYFDRIYRYIVMKVRNRADAEDLTQQVFMKAYESIDAFRWRGVPFAAWLFRIAHNQVVDHFRKRNRENTLPLDEAMTQSGPDFDPVVIAERRMQVKQLIDASGQLTEAQREVIALRFAGGLSVAETARAMGKSEGATKVLQHDALAKLRRIISFKQEEASGRAV